ncbi:hypothetical protein JMN32_14715 [Fulvivirga sp. 29W222]|uniref:Transketolase-like pyrimidine-binding domain-containing protein n=1 Tax=Fulvivirga marina TaxID=2494733 RepID=A0A937FYY9_9BACT|nr:transketolase C-terminal domain-containing protein [Fulvivirga marina]MBL6447568.1 hypothetical protein [Fulvivirga marina]
MMRSEKLANSCGKYLSQLMDNDSAIIVLDGDLADSNGAIYVQEKYENRFIMCGIAEQCMVSMAAGFAVEGYTPWVFSFASFLCYRAYDQIRVSVAQCNANVKLVGSHAGGFTGRNGKTHSAINDIAMMSSIPNMRIYSPASPEDTEWAVGEMNKHDGPAYIRLPREAMSSGTWKLGSWTWITKRTSVAIVTTGLALKIANQVREQFKNLFDEEIGIINTVAIHPVPQDLIEELNNFVDYVIVIEDHLTSHGLAALLKCHQLKCKIDQFGWPIDYMADSGDYEDILKHSELNPEKITTHIKNRYAFNDNYLAR